jgi:hypothetical protein
LNGVIQVEVATGEIGALGRGVRPTAKKTPMNKVERVRDVR